MQTILFNFRRQQMNQNQITGPDLRENRMMTAPGRPEPPGRLSPRWRNLLLTLHIVVAVGVIGADMSVITLGVTGPGPMPLTLGI